MSGDIVIIKNNEDLNLPYAVNIGTNKDEPLPGTIRYNENEDRYEGYLKNKQSYNDSNYAPMNMEMASTNRLGGVKIGNNLSITSKGTLHAVSESSTLKFQKILSVSQIDNVADYTSINQCINDFFGYNSNTNTYTGEISTLDSNDFPLPSENSRYIIMISPGVYNENDQTISIPPFISLIGQDRDSVIININNTQQLLCHSNDNGVQHIANLTINMNNTQSSNVIGIESSNCSNILINNIKWIITKLSGYNHIFINMSSGKNNIIDKIESNIINLTASNNENIYLLNSISTECKIKNCDISLSCHRGIKKFLNIISNSIINLMDSSLLLNEINTTSSTHRNECIFIENSDLFIKRSCITCNGYDILLNDNTHNNRGIVINNTSTKELTTQTNIIFVHYEDITQYDEILCPLNNIDLSSIFNIDDNIKINGANKLNNNSIFKIINIYSDEISGIEYSIIQVSKNDQLIDETFNDNNGLSIKSLYSLTINNSQLISTNSVINSLDNNNNYIIRISNSDIEGDKLLIGNNKIIFNTRQIIRVGKQNADFASINDAISSINDNNTMHRYIIYILPGLYYEQNQIILPDYVSLKGENKETVKIIFDTNDSLYPDDVAIKINNNCCIENITFKQYNKLDSSKSKMILIGSDNLDISESNASIIDNIEFYNCNINIESIDYLTINCFKLLKTNATINKININVKIKGNESNNQYFKAFNLILGDYKIYDPYISISGTMIQNAETTIFNNDRVIMRLENPQLYLNTSGSSSVINTGIKVENTVETNINLTDISEYTNILDGGTIRVYNGTVNNAIYSDYNATLFLKNLSFQGNRFLRNDEDNTYPNSVLKTLSCYSISTDSNDNIIDIVKTDNFGNSSSGNENILNGEDVGSINMNGNKNILFGLRIGTQLLTGNRNIMMGVDVGNHNYSLSDNVLIGVNAGNVMSDNKNVIIGSNTASSVKKGDLNNIIGYNSANDSNNITNINIYGSNSGSKLTNSSNLISIGNNNIPLLSNSSNSTYIGSSMLKSLQNSNNSIYLGHRTFNNIKDSENIIAIGSNIGSNINSGNKNVLIGNDVVSNLYSVSNSVILGYETGMGKNTGFLNNMVIIGKKTGNNIESSSNSVIIGSNIANNISNDASDNIFIGGVDTVSNITSGSDNIIIGTKTGNKMDTNLRNIILGNNTASNLDATDDIIVIGTDSGSNISGSDESDGKSIIIGNKAGQTLNTGGVILIGHEAGKKTTGVDSIIIGNEAGRTIKGARNTLLGNFTAGISDNSITNPVNGHDNILVGTRSGYSLTDGNFNMIFGSGDTSNGGAGNDLTSGDGNVLMGYLSGRNLTTGNYNFMMGRKAGYSMSKSSRNFIMGDQAGLNLGSLDTNAINLSEDNMIIGNEAALNLITGNGVLIIGKEAGYNSTSAIDNLYIGKKAGYTNTVGTEDIFIGNEAGYLNTSSQNTIIGVSAGKHSTTASRNTFIGYKAGKGKGVNTSDNNTGDENIAIGYHAGSNLVSGYQSILIGNNAGKNNESGVKNIMYGVNTGKNSNSSKNIFIGSTDSNTSGIGIITTGEYNIFMGVSVGELNTSGEENIFMGSHSGNKNTVGSNDIFIGNDAGKENILGNNNIKIGKEAGRDSNNSNNNVIIGPQAGKNAVSNDTIIIGNKAGQLNKSDNEIFIGAEAGKNNKNGKGGIMIGPKAGLQNEKGNNNIFIGHNSGSSFNRITDSFGENIYIGSNTGVNNETGIKNIVIGTETFEKSSNGSGVIAIGYRAGRNAGVSLSQTDDYNNIIIGLNAISEGDIGLNNTMIGSNVGRNVDNANKFIGNSFIGADAGKNANLSINSVILGNSCKIGTGGEDNIIAGFQTGNKIGNPNIINTLTLNDINNKSTNVTINLSYNHSEYYFKSGDIILIKDSANNIFETEIGSLTSNNGNTQINFNDFYNDEEVLETGSTLFSLSKLNDNVGILDNSKASSNTLMGKDAGFNIDEASKCVALGSSALYKNKKGKYNNILGTQAGYNVRSDNNTCYGTRAGYSIDNYTYTNNSTITDLKFISNTNVITTNTGNLSSFKFGKVFEVKESTSNNDRYIVKNSSSSSIVVTGNPEIDKSGVKQNIKDIYIKHEETTFNIMNKVINGNGLKIEKETEKIDVPIIYQYIKLADDGISDTSSNASKITDIVNAGILKITGSNYNNGIHYLKRKSDDAEIIDGVYEEVFDENVNIILKSITILPNDFDSNDTNLYFSKFLNGSYMNTYYGLNKNRNILDHDNLIYLNNKFYNNSILLKNTDLEQLLNTPENIFTEGYIENITNTDTHILNKKYKIFGEITFDSSNNTISFSKNTKIFDHIFNPNTKLGSIYKINGTNNNDVLFRISDYSNDTITIDTEYVSINDETINGNVNPVSITTHNIHTDKLLTNYELSDNYIINVSINNKETTNNGVLTNIYRDFDINGSFIINDIDNQTITSTISSTNYKDEFNTLSFSNNQLINPHTINNLLTINRDIYKVDNDYSNNFDSHITGYDFMYQTGSITPYTGVFNLYSSNNTIQAATKYQFTDLVAPVMIKVNNVYYLVSRNKYPFKELILDSINTPINSDDTTSLIEYHSISNYQNSSNLSSLFKTNTKYRIFNNNSDENHNKIIEPINNSNALSKSSIYLTDDSNIVTNNTNNRLISILDHYMTNSGTTREHINGIFKHTSFRASDVNVVINAFSNIDLTFHSDEINNYFTSNIEITSNIEVGDFVNITNSNSGIIDGLYEISEFIESTEKDGETTTIMKLNLNTGSVSSELSNEAFDFKINLLKIFPENDTNLPDDINFNQLYQDYRELVKFIRIGIKDDPTITSTDIEDDNNIQDTNNHTNIYHKILNFTTELDNIWNNGNIVASSTSNSRISFIENVPDDANSYIVPTSSGMQTGNPKTQRYGIFLGTPVLDNVSNIHNNVNKSIIGYIDYIDEIPLYDKNVLGLSSVTLENYNYILNTTTNFTDELQYDYIKGTLNIYSSNNYLKLSNLSFDTSNIGTNDYFQMKENDYKIYLSDKINNPFKYIKPGYPIDIYTRDTNTTSPNQSDSNTYIVKNIVDNYTLELESTKLDGSSISSDFTYNFNINKQLLLSTNINSNLGIHIGITGLNNMYLYSDRYDFHKIISTGPTANISTYNVNQLLNSNTNIRNYLTTNTSNISTFQTSPDATNSILHLSNVNITNYNYDFNNNLIISDIEPIYDSLNLDHGAHTLIIPTGNLSLIDPNPISFNNESLTGLTINFTKKTSNSSTIEFVSGGNTNNLSNGNIINISNSTNNDGYYLIKSLTSSLISIDNDYNNLKESSTNETTITVNINTINSSDSSLIDLSQYKSSDKLIVSKTKNNNKVYTIESVPTTKTSLYIRENVTTENPDFCFIEKSILIDEESSFSYTANINVDTSNSSNSEIRLTGSNSNSLTNFRPNQKITISGATENDNNTTLNIDSNFIPTDSILKIPVKEDEENSSIVLTKNILMTPIGESVESNIDGSIKRFHYLDAQGNNLMLGSFSGHYAGAGNFSIHNIYIGNKVGQTNQGSGNIFFGNETLFADTKDDGATNYSNKFAIYKNNFIGIPSDPLIGGDFASGRVGINTIDPDSLASTGTLDSATKLVVNGTVRASAHSTFTGTHKILLDKNINYSNIKKGMCLVSTGNVKKLNNGILDTLVTCKLSSKKNDKRIYGVYSHFEKINGIKYYYTASIGEGMLLVCNYNGEPDNGDYVTTSIFPGLSQLQDDDILHNYTIAKITENINWNINYNNITYDKIMYKYKLVSCTYHCG